LSSQEHLPQERAACLPSGVRATALRLESQGFAAWVTGESWMQVLLGRTPPAFEISTSAPLERCLDLFAEAVPTRPQDGIASLPSDRATIDLASVPGGEVERQLERRDFSVLAMAYHLAEERLVDPSGGMADLRQRRLRWVGDGDASIAADPVRMLRACRLAGDYGFDPTDVEEAIARSAKALAGAHPERLRAELVRTLLSDHPARGLALLQRTRLESPWLRSLRPDSPDLVAALPRRLPLRLAAWLRGTRPRPLLRGLRFGLVRSQHVERILEHHPLDERVDPGRERAIARLLRQLEPDDVDGLLRMREWELERAGPELPDPAESSKRLAAVREGIERLRELRDREKRRTQLAIDGRAVMQLLGYPPGPRVGAALRFAAERIARDPAENDPQRLRDALLAWDRAGREGEASREGS
jgi:tRNA nucleotidyltransferase/poly(A) polymerase